MDPALGTSLHFVRLSETVGSIPWNPAEVSGHLEWLKVINMQPWKSFHKEGFVPKLSCVSPIWVKL